MPFVQVGRTHSFLGKRLWEILGSLQDFGVGRMVVRSRFERYPEACYYRIVSAEPEMDNGRPHMDEDNMRGKVTAEQIFRGKNMGTVDLSKVSYKTDFRLIHKHEEAKYSQRVEGSLPRDVKIYPQTMDMPPLLKMLAEREGHSATTLKVNLNTRKRNISRIAKEGETPNVSLTIGLGTPASPELYEGVL
ncbi:uncharacterized protein LOC122266406 [Penaeus japonicus]|uniref:uncharacterized protein LOC122266406 n=1 Tax=Penaeus japonicus TaxID=27405 RepID=UPI001C7136B8|nr:uncharacterized protein LOC122266406 [Penaeus japonicus]